MVGEREIYWSRVVSAVFLPDRKSVVFGDNQESIWIWDADTGKRDSQPLGGHSESLSCLSFSSDGKYIAPGSEDKTTTIWDMNEREARTGAFRRYTRRDKAVKFSPTGNDVISR